MKPVLTIAAEWASFEQNVLADAGTVQRREMKRAFYAGAQSLLNTIMVGLDPDEEVTDGDMRRMENLALELARFGKDVQEGRA